MLAALLARVALGEPISRRTGAAMALALAGVAVMFGAPGEGSLAGDGLSMLAAFSFALMVVITRWRHDVSMTPATCLSQVILVVAFLPFASPGEITGDAAGWLALLGVGQIGLGFMLLTVGARLIPAAQVGLITLLEVVLGPVWVWAALDERPSTLTLVGGAVVITAIVIQTRGSPVMPTDRAEPPPRSGCIGPRNRYTLRRVLRLERAALESGDFRTATRSNIFTSPEWLEFVAATQNAEPVVARVMRGEEHVGWFTGLVVRRFGIRILGSPFAGWMTGPMGFDLAPGVSRREAARALLRFAFKDLRCLHVEMLDRQRRGRGSRGPGRAQDAAFRTLELDLTRDEDALLKGMSSSCRRALKKADREGVRVEEAHGVEFADEYYEQLLDVFKKQGRRPPYDVERVRQLIRSLEPTGNLLMLRAVGAEGERMATAIFPFGDGFAYFWGGASWRAHQAHRPNEPIFWHAIRHFKERGIPMLDLGGGGDFKRKFGPVDRQIPIMRRSRVPRPDGGARPGGGVLLAQGHRDADQARARSARRAAPRPPTCGRAEARPARRAGRTAVAPAHAPAAAAAGRPARQPRSSGGSEAAR